MNLPYITKYYIVRQKAPDNFPDAYWLYRTDNGSWSTDLHAAQRHKTYIGVTIRTGEQIAEIKVEITDRTVWVAGQKG